MAAPPIPCVWSGGCFTPLQRFHNVAAAHYGEGEVVHLIAHEERSAKTHAHYFACVTEAWRNLPEDRTQDFPTSEHLRKRALIMTGYRDERTIACASRAEALRVAAFVKPMDDFALVVTSGALVAVYTAKSQSQKAMDRETFAKSKEAVLGWVSDLIRVTPEQLQRANAA